jgi:acyl carrier protein
LDRAEVLLAVHKAAAEFAATNGRQVSPDLGEDDIDLLARYGFTSLDALEYLLVLEEKFGITFEDENLTQEVLSSAAGLVTYIISRQTSE